MTYYILIKLQLNTCILNKKLKIYTAFVLQNIHEDRKITCYHYTIVLIKYQNKNLDKILQKR